MPIEPMKKVLRYFLYVYFSPTGRINRAGWWLYWLFFFVMGLTGPSNLADTSMSTNIYRTFLGTLLLYSLIVVSIKRFHDTNHSGWRTLLWLVPVIGWFYVPLVCGFVKGTDGENKYGAPHLSSTGTHLTTNN